MLVSNYKEEFKKLSFQVESLKNRKRNTFNLKEKDYFNNLIIELYRQIDNLLDMYNKEK